MRTALQKIAAGYEVESGSSRVIPMEGLRGLAVLLVVFVHYHALFGEHLARGTWLRAASGFLGLIGNTGVDLFFVMSGYLIYGALIRRKVPYLKFTRRRIARIYPTFLAVFAVYLVLSALFPGKNKIHGHFYSAGAYVLENLLLLPGIFKIRAIISVAWSLSFEFFFYLTIPLVIVVTQMRNWKSRARLIAFIVVWVGIAAGSGPHVFFVMPDYARMISFVAGIVLYEVVSAGNVRSRLSRTSEVSAICLVVGALVLFYLIHQPRAVAFSHRLPVYFIISVAFFFFTLNTVAFPGVLSRMFSWSPIRYLGNMSYSYYLIHGLTLQALAKVLELAGISSAQVPIALACFVIGFAGTLISSSILFFVVEKRFSLVHAKEIRVTAAEQSAATAVGSSGS